MKLEHLRDRMGRAIRAMLVLNIVLTGMLAATAASGGPWWSREASTASGITAELDGIGPAQNPISVAEATRATTGRNTFRTGRATKTKKVDELAHFRFFGTSFREGRWRAFVKDTKFKKVRNKGVGDMLGAYKIIDINKKCITVQRGSEPPVEIVKG